jgi:arylsulfatase A-like enzyme
MATPNIDRLANEGMTFYTFYAQPSCTPGARSDADRAQSQPQRHDHGGIAGAGRRASSGRMDLGIGAEDSGLQHVLYRQSDTWGNRTTHCQTPKATTKCAMWASIT